VGNDANIKIGGGLVSDSLDVGGLLDGLDVAQDVDVKTITVGDQANMMIGGGLVSDSLDVGGSLTRMDVGQNADIQNIQVGGQANMDVGGNLTANNMNVGRDAILKVGGDTTIQDITAGSSFQLDGGRNLTFDNLDAGRVEVDVGGGIEMGQVNAGTASFSAGGSVNDNNSMLNVNNISIRAGGNVGSGNAPINLNVSTIDNISGNNIYLSQTRPGPLMVNTINAGNFLSLLVPYGQIYDAQNDGGLEQNAIINISAANALFDADQIGQRNNPLDVNIPGTISLRNSSGRPPESSYVWVHLANVANGLQGGTVDPDYTGNVPGLVIQNNQVVGGQDAVMREIFRTEAFYVETPELKSRQGVFGSPYFLHSYLQINEQIALGLIDYVLYGNAVIRPDPDLPPEAHKTIRAGESKEKTKKKSLHLGSLSSLK